MKAFTINIWITGLVLFIFTACSKENEVRETLPDENVSFNVSGKDFIEIPYNIQSKNNFPVKVEMEALLSDKKITEDHYITFSTDTTKISDYKAKYGNALLLPTSTYYLNKPTVRLSANTTVSGSAVLNLGFQNKFLPNSTYVLPMVISSIDGKVVEKEARKVVYYVFKTGLSYYVNHTGFTVTATASSTAGSNAASRVVDGNTASTYWASATTQLFPQSLNIDFGRAVSFSGVDCFYPTSVNITSVGGDPTSVKIETSSDNTTWTDRGTYAVVLNNTGRTSAISLPSLTTARYLRLTVLAANPYKSGAATYSVAIISEILLVN